MAYFFLKCFQKMNPLEECFVLHRLVHVMLESYISNKNVCSWKQTHCLLYWSVVSSIFLYIVPIPCICYSSIPYIVVMLKTSLLTFPPYKTGPYRTHLKKIRSLFSLSPATSVHHFTLMLYTFDDLYTTCVWNSKGLVCVWHVHFTGILSLSFIHVVPSF